MKNQKLFNFLSENGFTPLQSDMDEIRKIVFEGEINTDGKTEKQIQVEKFIIEDAMPKIEKDLLAIVDNVFKADLTFSKTQLESKYALSGDILCLGLKWLGDYYSLKNRQRIIEMNKLEKYIGIFKE